MVLKICIYTRIFSLLDGYGTVEEYCDRAKQINQRFLCITDHGMMGAVPRQIKATDKAKLQPIFGCELYVNPMQPELKPGESSGDYYKQCNEAQKKIFKKSYHLLGIAYSNLGYSNLVKLSSWGWTKGVYYKPRVNHDILMKHKEGIIFTSCCYNSEIGQAFENGGEDAAMQMVEKYLAMFGEDFRLEFMLLDFKKQKPYDAFIMKAHAKFGIPLIVTNDCHYSRAEDSKMQQLMLMIQTKRTIQEIEQAKANNEDLFELQDQNLYMKSEEEIDAKWKSDYSHIIDYELLKQAKRNTVAICEKAKGVQLDRSLKLPKFDDDKEKLLEAIVEGFNSRHLPKTAVYASRLKEEYSLISEKELSSYFLLQKMMTEEARRMSSTILGWGDGSEAIGPGRGSVVGSLVAYCLRITDIDPVEHDLLFSRFLSPARAGKTMKLVFTEEPMNKDEE